MSESIVNSQKRKIDSSDNENQMNLNKIPNANSALGESDAKKSRLSSTRTSGLPRYSSTSGRSRLSTRTSVSAGNSNSVSSRDSNTSANNSLRPSMAKTSSSSSSVLSSSSSSSSRPTTSSSSSTTTTPSRSSMLRSTATPSRTTPSRSSSVGTPADLGSSAALLISRIRKIIANTPQQDRIRSYFDAAFSINSDEQITSIISTKLKAKRGVDLKEKCTKQAAVITELRSTFKTLFDESRKLKDLCINCENLSNTSLCSALNELQEVLAVLTSMQSSEARVKRELAVASEQLAVSKASLAAAEKERLPLAEKITEAESKAARVAEKLAAKEAMHKKDEEELQRLRTEILELRDKISCDSAESIAMKETQLEAATTAHKQEIEVLKEEASKYRSQVQSMTAALKTSEGETLLLKQRCEMSEKSVERLENSLEKMRGEMSDKDADLRSTLQSIAESGRAAAEEKGAMRVELTGMQTRVRELEDERVITTSELASKKEEVIALTRDISTVREQLMSSQSSLDAAKVELGEYKDSAVQLGVEKELRNVAEQRVQEEKTERIAACAQLSAVQMDYECFKIDSENLNKIASEKSDSQLHALRIELEAVKSKALAAEEKVVGLTAEIDGLKSSLDNADRAANHEAVEQLAKASGELEVLRKRVKEANESAAIAGNAGAARIQELEEALRKGEIQRRKLHNLVQELRGNVRVFARVRPFLPNDGVDSSNLPESAVQPRADGGSLRILKPDDGKSKAEEHTFNFDKVFGGSTSQESIFGEVSEFVQSALDGYSVCLMSYGQTGSGKTHTMQGSGDGAMRGIIPRAMQQVGKYKSELEAKGWAYEMQVTFIEIYNETIRDLLRTGSNAESGKHEIKKDANGGTYISDVQVITVDPNDAQQVDSIMRLANSQRSVASTSMNEQSSRSHSVFRLHLRATHAEQNIRLKGDLSLVDLAGSERLDRSQATGENAKEAMAINKSLSSLKDVFTAIGNKNGHVPFRNSKLTYLLQPALSGDGKTLMMVNLSPTEASYYESLCSLRFASQVNQCELGKPRRQLRDGSQSQSASSTLSNSATRRR